MFMSGEGLRVMLLVINIAVVLLAGVLVAHLVWVVRLARSPELAGRSGPARAGIVAAALVTPVLGFYVAGIVALWRARASGAPAAALRRLAVMVGLALALAALGTGLVESRYVPEHRTWRHPARAFTGQAGFLLALEAVLFMIVRVFTSGSRRAPWIAFSATAAILLLLVW